MTPLRALEIVLLGVLIVAQDWGPLLDTGRTFLAMLGVLIVALLFALFSVGALQPPPRP